MADVEREGVSDMEAEIEETVLGPVVPAAVDSRVTFGWADGLSPCTSCVCVCVCMCVSLGILYSNIYI